MKRYCSATLAATITAASFAPAFAQDCAPATGTPLSSYRVDTMAENQHHVHTEILINASAAEVWDVLSDFENIQMWSTTLQLSLLHI